jgi:2'-5' RNA ligase
VSLLLKIMKKIRSFIAIAIDTGAKEKILCIIDNLKKSNADVKWADENQLHLTLKFLGDIDEALIQKISATLSSISSNFQIFTLTFSEIGWFPNINNPRVIWLGIEKGTEPLIALNEILETELEKIGFKRDGRKFTPHLTLARIRTQKNITSLTKLINDTNPQIQNEFKIDKLILYQSTLTPKRAIYTPIYEADFKPDKNN